MDEPRDEFPEVRLSDAFNGDGFPVWGPRTPLSDAVLDDALARLMLCPETHIPEVRCACGANVDSAAAYAERLKAQTRAAKEIAAAHADPDWLNGH